MNRSFRSSSTQSRTALTLVELLAGLVVLGTLLAGVVAARGRFLDQWGEAEMRLKAVAEAETLVWQWLAGRAEEIPVPSAGPIPGLPDHQWRTRWVADAADLSTRVARLEVLPRKQTSGRPARPLVSIDFLVRYEPPAATQPAAPAPATEARR